MALIFLNKREELTLAYYHNEIQQGFCGLGNYSLISEFASARHSEDEIHIISTYSPVDIVAKMRERISSHVHKSTVDKSEAISLMTSQHS